MIICCFYNAVVYLTKDQNELKYNKLLQTNNARTTGINVLYVVLKHSPLPFPSLFQNKTNFHSPHTHKFTVTTPAHFIQKLIYQSYTFYTHLSLLPVIFIQKTKPLCQALVPGVFMHKSKFTVDTSCFHTENHLFISFSFFFFFYTNISFVHTCCSPGCTSHSSLPRR